MEESELIPKEKKEKIKNWLRDKNNFFLVLAFISILIIRVYFFILTKNQPMWWDESEYMAAAKSYAGIGHYGLGSTRLPGFPILASFFFRFGLENEVLLRFFLAFIPSILVIFLLYLCIKEMYSDKKIAIVSILILSVLWEHVFYSNRFHTENSALIFELLAILVLFKSYLKKESFAPM